MFPLKDNIPTQRFPIVTIAIIVANVVVFLLLQKASISFGGANVDDVTTVHYGAIPFEFSHPGDSCDLTGQITNRDIGGEVTSTGGEIKCFQKALDAQPQWYLTALSSMFMHGGLLHIVGNMLFLWIFGNNVEDAMGRVRFVVFYLLGGAAALAAQILFEPNSTVPTIGASGAVAGVLGGYILLYPKARVLTAIFVVFFFTLIEIPAIFALGFWFVQQIVLGALDASNPVGEGGGVAYFAHIGGFVFGLLLIRAFVAGRGDRRGAGRDRSAFG